MAEISFPTAGGGSVTDSPYERLIGTVVPSGLIGTAALSDLVYADSSGRQVKVQPNRSAMVRGFHWESDGAGIVRSIAANAVSNPRIDLAVLRLNRSDFSVSFQVIQGAAGTSPVAPSPTQNTGSTGVWELPLAQIDVAAGTSSLGPSTVRPVAWYIGGPSYVGRSGAFPPITQGATFTAQNTSKVYVVAGGGWHLVAEDGDLVPGTAATGWGNPNVYYQRRNGFVHMQAVVQRTGAELPAETNSVVFNIPAAYRPLQNIIVVAYAGHQIMRCLINSTTGDVTLTDYGVRFGTGATLTIQTCMWPSTN